MKSEGTRKTVTAALLGLALLFSAACTADDDPASTPGGASGPTQRPEDDELATTPGFESSPTQELIAGELTAERLYGHAFTATSVRGDAATEELMDGVPFRLESHQVGSVSVKSDCNTLGLTFTIDAGTATPALLSTTLKECAEERHVAHDEWLEAFFTSSPQRWTWDGSELVLVHGGTTVRMVEDEKEK